MTLKIAVFAPMPSASVTIRIAVSAGVCRKERTACRKSVHMSGASFSAGADGPRRLLSDARVAVLQRWQQSRQRPRVADSTEGPRSLLTDTAALIRQRVQKRVHGARVVDRAESPRGLLAYPLTR